MHDLTCIEVFEEPLLKAALLHTVSGCPGMSIFEYSTTLIRQLRKARIMQKAGKNKKKKKKNQVPKINSSEISCHFEFR